MTAKVAAGYLYGSKGKKEGLQLQWHQRSHARIYYISHRYGSQQGIATDVVRADGRDTCFNHRSASVMCHGSTSTYACMLNLLQSCSISIWGPCHTFLYSAMTAAAKTSPQAVSGMAYEMIIAWRQVYPQVCGFLQRWNSSLALMDWVCIPNLSFQFNHLAYSHIKCYRSFLFWHQRTFFIEIFRHGIFLMTEWVLAEAIVNPKWRN